MLQDVHSQYGVDWRQLCGISALDLRRENSILLSSYICHNIEELHWLGPEKNGWARFLLIWSSHTFHHFVDPLSVLRGTFTQVSCSRMGGIAIIRHIPLLSLGLTPADIAQLNSFLAEQAHKVLFVETRDCPGNFTCFAKRALDSPEVFELPISFTGEVHKFGGASCYLYASVALGCSFINTNRREPSSCISGGIHF